MLGVNLRPERKGTLLGVNVQVEDKPCYSFSFENFDRSHPLFNLGSGQGDRIVESRWFLGLLDCLKEVSRIRICDLRGGKFDLHPVDWDNVNPEKPPDADQYEYLQFRLNKSKGRIVGFDLNGVFYVVWIDPHHHTSNSPHYPKAAYYATPKSEYELLLDRVRELEQINNQLNGDLKAATDLLYAQ